MTCQHKKRRAELEHLFKDRRMVIPSWEDFDALMEAIIELADKWRDKWHDECCGEGG